MTRQAAWIIPLMLIASQAAVRSAAGATNSFKTTGTDYSTASDWNLGTIPGNGNNDEPWIGNNNTAAATYNSATGYTTTGRMVVGISGSGNGTLTMNGSAGTLTFGGNDYYSANYIGVDGGTGVVNVNAGTIVTGTGAALRVGANSSGNGTLNLGGGSVTVGGILYMGVGSGTTTGAINITSASSTLTASQYYGRVGTYTQSAGTANFLSASAANVIGDTVTSTFNANGGTTNFIDGSGVSGHLYVGVGSATADGIMNVGGGTVNIGTRLLLGNNTSGAKGVLTISSGSVSIGTGTNTDGDKGTVYLASYNNGATGKGIVNLNGGTLSLVRFEPALGTNGASQKEVNFNGGTVQARANSTTFLNAATGFTANVKNGGAIFDTDGKNITVAAALLNSGSGGLTKQDTGTLTLSNTNTYIGNTVISGGTLALASSGSINNTPLITVGSGATFDVSAVSGYTLGATQTLAGVGTVAGNVALAAGANLSAGNSPGTLTFTGNLDVSNTGGSNSGDLLFDLGSTSDLIDSTAGTLTIGSALGFNDFTFTAGSGFGPGVYTLFQTTNAISGALDGSNLTGTVGGYGASLSLADSNTDLILTVVPEPSSFAMLLFGSLMLWAVRRSRK